MKISIEAYDTKHIIETPNDDISMEELYQLLKQLCMSAGYYSNNANKYFEEE